MKKILTLLAVTVVAFVSGCNTNVGVESSANPVASYDSMTGVFQGELKGSVQGVYDATMVALTKNLGYYCTGQNKKDPAKKYIRARSNEDQLVMVTIKQGDQGLTLVQIEIEDGGLMGGQKVFNEIAKETRAL